MKGLIYTIIAALVIASTLSILWVYSRLSNSLRNDVTEKIISDQLHHFESNIEADIERAIDIIGRRALIASVEHVVETGIGLDDARIRIKELMEEGTIYGIGSGSMANNTIANWTKSIENVANQTSFLLTLKINLVDIKPFDSFHILFEVNATINLTERTKRIRIDRFFNKSVITSIEGLEDPLAPNRTGGFYKKTIMRSPYEDNYSYEESGVWHFENLIDHINKGYYQPVEKGASFLDRLEGRLETSNKYQNLAPGRIIGLEHFVNVPKLASLGLTVHWNKTVVDHLYWDESFAGSSYLVNDPNIPSWFRIDKETDSSPWCSSCKHNEIYGIPETLLVEV